VLSLGGAALVAVIWVAVKAFRNGVGPVGLVVAVAAAGVLGWGADLGDGAATVWSSVTPTLNNVGSGGVG
jgi:hypothetical protein